MLLQESIGQERRPLSWVVGDQGVYRAEMPAQKDLKREQRIQGDQPAQPRRSVIRNSRPAPLAGRDQPRSPHR